MFNIDKDIKIREKHRLNFLIVIVLSVVYLENIIREKSPL